LRRINLCRTLGIMTRKTVPLPNAGWISDYVSPTSHRHALLAERVHLAPDDLRGEGKVLAALIEVGRQVLEEQVERALYDQLYGGGLPDDETAGAFALYDEEADAALAAGTVRPSPDAEQAPR